MCASPMMALTPPFASRLGYMYIYLMCHEQPAYKTEFQLPMNSRSSHSNHVACRPRPAKRLYIH